VNFVWVAIGGAVGASARYGLNHICARYLGSGFPWGTLVANVLGCFAIGLLAGTLFAKAGASDPAKLFWLTGVLGGFTTFSAFAFDTAQLAGGKDVSIAGLYVLASVGLALLGVYSGLILSRTFQ
jgi:fluoride exporter